MGGWPRRHGDELKGPRSLSAPWVQIRGGQARAGPLGGQSGQVCVLGGGREVQEERGLLHSPGSRQTYLMLTGPHMSSPVISVQCPANAPFCFRVMRSYPSPPASHFTDTHQVHTHISSVFVDNQSSDGMLFTFGLGGSDSLTDRGSAWRIAGLG